MIRAVLLPILATLALAASAVAAAPTQRATLPDVEDEVMCVVCGTPLNLAQAPQADRERVFIQRLIDQGLTKEQIKGRLEAQYGPTVLALPRDSGFEAAAYIVPIAVVGLALLALAVAVPRWRRERSADGRAAHAADEGREGDGGAGDGGTGDGGTGEGRSPEATPAEVRRLDEELARFEG
jgi:cytochrome c-type biogenesis protein CcmH